MSNSIVILLQVNSLHFSFFCSFSKYNDLGIENAFDVNIITEYPSVHISNRAMNAIVFELFKLIPLQDYI